jgi:hypothetical protein
MDLASLGTYLLTRINAGEVELWLRSLLLARSNCAKARKLMSVLFNQVWQSKSRKAGATGLETAAFCVTGRQQAGVMDLEVVDQLGRDA